MFLLFVSDDRHDMVTDPVAPMCSVTLSPLAIPQCSARSGLRQQRKGQADSTLDTLSALSLAQIPNTARTLLWLTSCRPLNS